VAGNSNGFSRKRARNYWFDKEFEEINEEKHAFKNHPRDHMSNEHRVRKARSIQRQATHGPQSTKNELSLKMTSSVGCKLRDVRKSGRENLFPTDVKRTNIDESACQKVCVISVKI
jgi:hypothetical protein